PHQDGGLARVSIYPPSSLELAKQQPTFGGSAASKATTPFEGGDVVVAVDGERVAEYPEFAAKLLDKSAQPVAVTVRRGDDEVDVEVAPQPMRRVGLVVEFGTVFAVQENSPAASLDTPIRPGDFIERFDDGSEDGEGASWDPVTTPERLRRLAAEKKEVELTIRRAASGADERGVTETVTAPLRVVPWLESPMLGADAVSAPSLGIAYRIVNRVHAVEPGSPAERAGLQSGDRLRSVEFVYPADAEDAPPAKVFELGEDSHNDWAGVLSSLQFRPLDVKLKITYERGEETHEAIVEPEASSEQFAADRGFAFLPMQRTRKAETFGEQVQRGWQETVSSLGMVYRFLSKLGTQVPLTSLGGPITIVKQAGYSAIDGMGNFLAFLTMLSANLAVINFLPIPLLDGGHMAFLLYEGVRGKPASERLVVALHLIGFAFILSLMAFVLGLDFNLIERNL
ncbi:MAG: site-2 protease family protein, partial [Planctomycetales bacterium]|nr:site-2 protease family protein [Planctomycetales bacterium]